MRCHWRRRDNGTTMWQPQLVSQGLFVRISGGRFALSEGMGAAPSTVIPIQLPSLETSPHQCVLIRTWEDGAARVDSFAEVLEGRNYMLFNATMENGRLDARE